MPAAVKDLLGALLPRLGLVAFVTGRALEDGRRMIPLEGAAYVGAHGVEFMAPGGDVRIEPQAEPYLPLLREAAAQASRDLDCERLGIIVEEKPVGFALHYRLARDPDAARHEILTRVVRPARERGLAVMTGHFALRGAAARARHQRHGDAPAAGGGHLRDGPRVRRRPHRRGRLPGGSFLGRQGRAAHGLRRGRRHGRDASAW